MIQKDGASAPVKNTLVAFGFATAEIGWPTLETKEPFSREWPGEDGEDVYIPAAGLPLKAFDVEIEFLYRGGIDTAMQKFLLFRDYLTGADGSGAWLKIYDPYWAIGYVVFIRKMTDLSPFRTNADEGMSFKVTFRVTDPRARVVAGVTNGEIVNLGVI